MKPPLVFGTLIEHGAEVPDNEAMIFNIKQMITHKEDKYVVVVKSSKKALLDLPGTKMYSVLQLFKDDKEVFHEIYPSILRESQAEKMIEQIRSDITPYLK